MGRCQVRQSLDHLPEFFLLLMAGHTTFWVYFFYFYFYFFLGFIYGTSQAREPRSFDADDPFHLTSGVKPGA
jgi:hypothetical protein